MPKNSIPCVHSHQSMAIQSITHLVASFCLGYFIQPQNCEISNSGGNIFCKVNQPAGIRGDFESGCCYHPSPWTVIHLPGTSEGWINGDTSEGLLEINTRDNTENMWVGHISFAILFGKYVIRFDSMYYVVDIIVWDKESTKTMMMVAVMMMITMITMMMMMTMANVVTGVGGDQ